MAALSLPLSPRQAVERLLADLHKPAKLLVAVSGGSDSAGLLLALSRFNPPHSGVTLTAATVDHALRPESADEARHVAALCARIGIAHLARRWEGEKPKSGMSAAAREARYRLLVEMADEIGADAILTGHTSDDQMETVAMRAARNETDGNLGLAGMAGAVLLDMRRWLLRPFLQTRRADIRAFLTEAEEGWIDDPSNLNPRYERVRVRGTIAAAATSVGSDLSAQAEAAERRRALSDAAAIFLRDHAAIAHAALAHIDRQALQENAEVRNHALSVLAAVLGGRAHGMPADSLRKVVAFLDGGLPGRITAGRVIFDLRRDGLFMMRESRGLPVLHLAAGEAGVWDGRYRIRNGGAQEIVITQKGPDRDEVTALFPDAPPAVAMRAAAGMPCLDRGGSIAAAASEQQIHMAPILAPFDRFLPEFELNLASALTILFGCDDIPRLPIKDCARKS